MNIITVFTIIAALVTVGYVFAAQVALAGLWKLPVCFVLAFLAAVLVYVICLYVHTLFLKEEPKKERSLFYNSIAVQICQIIQFFCNVKTVVVNRDQIPTQGRFLMVANHRSMFDPLTMMSEFKDNDMIFISKPENFKIPLVGKIAIQAGDLSIDRENNREAMKTILKTIDLIKRDVCSAVIYPEGTRSKDGQLLPFHAGSFKIAQKAHVPVVICCCKNTESVAKNAPWRRTKVELKIVEVVSADRVTEMNTNELAEYARNMIAKELGQA